MEITVQKYGGSSLATEEQITRVARQVAHAHHQGDALIVVVSARGGTTDELLRSAVTVSAEPDPQETDKLLATGENAAAALLAIALRELGVPAVSLTGPQAGLRAAGRFGFGVVSDVDTKPVRRWLARRHVTVVAGFQAGTDQGMVITLGRGGSDTSAVALAVAHGASRCEIYTDVDGVRRADPRVVPAAALLPEIAADVMAEMAFTGARIMHSRAVELAAAHDIDITVRDSAHRGAGTTIIGRRLRMHHAGTAPGRKTGFEYEQRAGVAGVTHDRSVAQLIVHTSGRLVSRAAGILDSLAQRQIVVDALVWRTRNDEDLEMSCCVPETTATDALSAANDIVRADGGSAWVRRPVGTVSVVGIGLLSRPGLTALAMRTLLEAGIDAECVSCTQARVTFLLDAERVHDAVAALHDRFDLGSGADGEEPALATA